MKTRQDWLDLYDAKTEKYLVNTKGNHNFRIFTIDSKFTYGKQYQFTYGKQYPIIGEVEKKYGWDIMFWTIEGIAGASGGDEYNLIPLDLGPNSFWVRHKKIKRWTNVYSIPVQERGELYKTHAAAVHGAIDPSYVSTASVEWLEKVN